MARFDQDRFEPESRLRYNLPKVDDTEAQLSSIIERLRRRWRIRLVLGGLFWVLALGASLLAIESWALHQWHFAPSLINALRVLTLLAFIVMLLWFCLRPARRRVSDTQVARYFEEHEPQLKTIVSSAVDAARSEQTDISPALRDRLIEQAIDASRQAGNGDRIEAAGLKLALARNLGLVLLIAACIAWRPAFVSDSLSSLLMPWVDASEFSPYRIEISPGDIEIARGADQLISASIAGFDGADVRLVTSTDNGASWHESEMTPGQQAGSYDGFLFDLTDDVEYYVTGAGQQSPVHRITVADIPAIAEIALRYHYPAYTMLEPRLTEGGGDITALRGTRVEILITPTIDIPGGELVLDDGQRIALARSDSGPWSGAITVVDDGAYQVALQRASGATVDASSEFRITALADSLPSVSILSPGRDTRVSMIEEPVMAIRAADDQGIAELQLVLSVNGGGEQVIALLPGQMSNPNREVDAEHILMLEDLDLQPGDLISYYVRATDRAPVSGAQTTTSDMFFYQVRPFDTSYRRSDQRAGGGGGGGNQGGQQGGFLSEQQKQFVVATFKMIRDRNNYSEEAYQENLDLLAKAEARIRDRVEAIVRRIGSRALIQVDERYKIITEELPRAAEKMREVEQQLKQAQVESALADAQVALTHLQRADAVFREMTVSLAGQNGGGSGANTGFEDLANLFQLEMDKLRHQYESVQRGQQQTSPQALIDETMEKLRELARRQQKEVERRMRAQGQPASAQSRQRQLALAEELEDMARRLERLTRQQQNPRLQQSIDSMRNAAEAMRRSTGAGGDGMQQARQAAESLQQAQRLLDQGKMTQFSEALQRTLKRAQLVEKQQSAIRQDVAEIDQDWNGTKEDQLNQLEQRKQDLHEQLSSLEQELGELTTRSREQQPKANQSLKQAMRAPREYRLHDRIRRTRQMLLLSQHEAALENESEIQSGIRRMREDIETALQNIGEPEERGLQRSVEQMQALARELSYLRERAAQRQGLNPGSDQNQGREQNQGRGQSQSQGQGQGQGRGQSQSQGQGQGRGQGQNQGQGIAGSSRQTVDGQGGYPINAELEAFAERARDLRGALISQQIAAGDIDAVLEKIDRLVLGGGNQAELHDRALRALMQLEYRLRQQLEQHEYPEFFVSDPAELPAEYRDMVAEYFRSLSQP